MWNQYYGPKGFKYLGIRFTKRGIDWPFYVDMMTEEAKVTTRFFQPTGMNGFGVAKRSKTTLYKLLIRLLI